MLLAIDTSNDYAGVALWDDGDLRAEALWLAGRQHTEQVLPQIDLLLQHAGEGPRVLSAVAVATGPGSWSGLRVGMSLAKALCVGRGLPIVGVPTLEALAYGQRGRAPAVLAVVRLGRDRYAVTRYEGSVETWRCTLPPQALSARELAPMARDVLLIGDVAELLAMHEMEAAQRAGPSDHQRRAAYVAELAWKRHRQDDHDDLVALEPIYLGSPVRGS